MKQLQFLKATFFVIFAAVIAIACSKGENGQSPQNQFIKPELNVIQEAKMERRNSTIDNYTETCLFLNDSFKNRNTCAISVQTDLSFTGTQVTDQESEFKKLPKGSNLSSYSSTNLTSYGDIIEPTHLKVGDIWYFYKKNTYAEYEMIFEITSLSTNEVKVKYQVISFKHLN